MTGPAIPPGAVQAAARERCEHYWAFHCYGGLSVRLCQLCHEPDWDELRSQLTGRPVFVVAVGHDLDATDAENIQRAVMAALRERKEATDGAR